MTTGLNNCGFDFSNLVSALCSPLRTRNKFVYRVQVKYCIGSSGGGGGGGGGLIARAVSKRLYAITIIGAHRCIRANA